MNGVFIHTSLLQKTGVSLLLFKFFFYGLECSGPGMNRDCGSGLENPNLVKESSVDGMPLDKRKQMSMCTLFTTKLFSCLIPIFYIFH